MQIQKRTFYFFLLLIPFFSPHSYFEKIIGTAGNDYARSVKQLPDGTIYLFGDTDSGKYGGNDLSLIKLDNNGNLLWKKFYGTASSENGFYLNTTSDKNFVFTGEQTTASGVDIVIYKVDTSGTVIWNKTYSTYLNESPNYIEQTADGGYILAGAQNDSLGYNDLFILKLSATGDYQWHKTFGPAKNEYAKIVHQLKDGYMLIGDMGDSLSSYDVIVYKLDAAGNEVWSKKFGDSLVNGTQGFIVTSDGNYLLYGETETSPGSRFDGVLEKIDANGNSLWRNTYGGTGADAVFSVTEARDGGFVCTGYSCGDNGNKPLDVFVFKTDASGKTEWQQTYGGKSIDIGYEVIKNQEDSGYIIAGVTSRSGDDCYLLQVNEKGIITGSSTPGEPAVSMESRIDIYPNPAKGKVNLSYELNDGISPGTCSLILQDVFGHQWKIGSFNGKTGTVEIDMDHFNPGVYFCSILSDQGELIGCKPLVVK